MALIIPLFKKGGLEFTSAYAKVSEIRFNNDTKVASFNLKVFKSKEDRNLITSFDNLFSRIVPGMDITTQCYMSIKRSINEKKSEIEAKQAESDLIVDPEDTMKLKLLNEIDNLQNKDILQLENAESDLPKWVKPVPVTEPVPEDASTTEGSGSDEPAV